MVKQIELTQGKVAIVDDDDFEYLSQWKWHYTAQGYAARRSSDRIILMHRQLISTADGMDTDHANGNKLDNRRSNLRPATRSQNLANRPSLRGRSEYKGVSWHEARKKWAAHYYLGGESHYIGLFVSEQEAAAAYDEAAKRVYGEYAYLNLTGGDHG